MTDLMKPEQCSVVTVGELVISKLGNVTINMHWTEAIQYSTWLRIRGKEAKRNAGDHTTHWSVIGNLKDVMNGGQPWGKG